MTNLLSNLWKCDLQFRKYTSQGIYKSTWYLLVHCVRIKLRIFSPCVNHCATESQFW